MNTIKIPIPDGFEVESFDTNSGEVKLRPVPVNIRKRLNNMADVFAFHNTSETEFNKSCEGLSPDEIGYRKEKLIVAAYNNNVIPDWSDNTPKLYPIFKMLSSVSGFSFDAFACWLSCSDVGSRLVFVGPEAHENLLDAVQKFLPEYEQSRTA